MRGIWSHSNITHTELGSYEQIVYDQYLYVYVTDGVVTAVKSR